MSFSNLTSKTEHEHIAFTLLEHVRKGDLAAARNLFEESFWSGKTVQPAWHHLKLAVLNDDPALARLLVAWGATPPSVFDLTQLRLETAEDYDRHLGFMRRCGLCFDGAELAIVNTAVERIKEVSPDSVFSARHSIVRIPFEWWKALQAFHERGAAEAIIAGGALRDLYNKKPVRDVDIFLVSRGRTKANEKFIREVFKEAGLSLVPQMTRSGGYYTSDKYSDLPPPKTGRKEIITGASNYWSDLERREAVFENWVVKAGLDKTEYNIIFMDPFYKGKDFASKVIKEFDVGLCQIGTDGKSIFYTPQYKSDVQTQTITALMGGNHDHLKKVVAKYPDWKLSSLSKMVLGEPDAATQIVPEVGTLSDDGIFMGQYTHKGKGKSLGKVFNVYAAPQDLTDECGNKAVLKYVDAVKRMAELRDWHGFDGTDYANDEAFYDALNKGSYKGGWIIPMTLFMSDSYFAGYLYKHRNTGAFKGTFTMRWTKEDADNGRFPYNYWSSTELYGDRSYVGIVNFWYVEQIWAPKDYHHYSCRPVRLVEVSPPAPPKPPSGRTLRY